MTQVGLQVKLDQETKMDIDLVQAGGGFGGSQDVLSSRAFRWLLNAGHACCCGVTFRNGRVVAALESCGVSA
jgi:hypothetical protein